MGRAVQRLHGKAASNNALHLTASSVRSCVAPASGKQVKAGVSLQSIAGVAAAGLHSEDGRESK
jgi:hypothetical protein